MKIGILTYHRAENFGAAMQAYALQHYLNVEGYDAEIIDFRCKTVEMQYDIYNPRIVFSRKNVILSLSQYLSRFNTIHARLTRKRKFKEFQKLLKKSKTVYRKQDIAEYDALLVGSDQVWNFYINRNDENVYLLDFPVAEGCSKYAYAASSERNGFLPISKAELCRCLNGFNRISVREGFIKEMIEGITDKDVVEVLDPSFLLEKDDYLKLSAPIKAKDYVLVYQMTYSSEMLSIAKEMAEKNNLQLIELYGGYNDIDDDTHISSWGPKEVLSYIANATMVFTTSFHGLVFSLIFEKDVWVFDKGNNYRQKNLLNKAGLSQRLMSSVTECTSAHIDYELVNNRLKVFKQQSKVFLRLIK